MLPWDKVLNFPWERPGREHRVSQSHLPPPSTAPRSPQNPPLVLVWGWVHALGLCYGVEAMQCFRPWQKEALNSQKCLHGRRNEERNAENVTHQQNHPWTVQCCIQWGRAG